MRYLSILCVLLLVRGSLQAQQPPPQTQTPAKSQTLSPEQLDSLTAPIALYPDPLLAQVLAASTYPLEIVEASRWLQQNKNLKAEQLTDAAKKQNWDPSVQAMVVFPDVLKRMNDNLQWTTDLGNAVLAQQSDVMAAIQRLRAKAKESGKLDSTQQQKVVSKVDDGKTIIEIQPSQPQVIYVPSYNPTYVWGPPPYPYPPVYYPPYPTGAVVATSAIAFGTGVALGAAFGGCCGWGGWGWGCNWGGNNVEINNNFFHRYNYQNANINRFDGNSNWTHNSAHRQGVPYANRDVSQRFGGGQQGQLSGRDLQGSLQQGLQGRGGLDKAADRMRDRQPRQIGDRQPGQVRDRMGGEGMGQRGGGQQFPQRAQDRGWKPDTSAFSGAGHGAMERAHSDRGFSSLSGSRGGGGFHGGGFGGGGSRGGGGGFRGGGRR